MFPWRHKKDTIAVKKIGYSETCGSWKVKVTCKLKIYKKWWPFYLNLFDFFVPNIIFALNSANANILRTSVGSQITKVVNCSAWIQIQIFKLKRFFPRMRRLKYLSDPRIKTPLWHGHAKMFLRIKIFIDIILNIDSPYCTIVFGASHHSYWLINILKRHKTKS